MQRTRQKFDPAPLPLPTKFLHQQHVLHQPNFSESAQCLERPSPQKNSLIAVRNLPPADSCGVAPFEPTKDRTVVLDLLPEGSAHNLAVGQSRLDLASGSRFEPTIRVQKQQDVAACRPNPGIELMPSSALRGHDDRSGGPRKVGGSVLTLAIDNDDFDRT